MVFLNVHHFVYPHILFLHCASTQIIIFGNQLTGRRCGHNGPVPLPQVLAAASVCGNCLAGLVRAAFSREELGRTHQGWQERRREAK